MTTRNTSVGQISQIILSHFRQSDRSLESLKMPHSRNENGTGSVHMMDFMDFVACLAVQRSGRGKGTGDLGGGGSVCSKDPHS